MSAEDSTWYFGLARSFVPSMMMLKSSSRSESELCVSSAIPLAVSIVFTPPISESAIMKCNHDSGVSYAFLRKAIAFSPIVVLPIVHCSVKSVAETYEPLVSWTTS